MNSYNIENTADDGVSLTPNNTEDIVSNKLHNLKTELETVNMDLASKNADIVGFSDDINIEENELTKMLENFEQEELDNQQSSVTEDLKKTENIINNSTIATDIIENTMIQGKTSNVK